MASNSSQIINAATVLMINHLLVNCVSKIAGNEISNTSNGVSINDALIYRMVAYKTGDLIRLKLGSTQ